MQLYNKLSAEERAKLITDAGLQRLTLSFYAYAKISNPQDFRNTLFVDWNKLDALGRIYVANEGINAQMSLPAENFEAFKNTLDKHEFLKGIRLNVAIEQDDLSFLKLTIKVKSKIVADGLNDDTFDVTNKGIHLRAAEFNKMLENPNTVVVDFRNHYESEVGHFTNAITPDVDTFRESLPIIENQLQNHKEDKNLLMYCTGGIRCEKASAYFKHKGFKNVFQLEGGIIEYAKQIKEEGLESKFIGKNFVFDHRLGERVTEDIIAKCHQCGEACDTHVNCINDGCHLLFIQCESCADKMQNCCSEACLTVVNLPEDEQKKLRQGNKNGLMVFKKGKSDALTFKQPTERNVFTEIAHKTNQTATIIRNKKAERKQILGTAQHYFTKQSIGLFLIEKSEVQLGDTLLIKGPSTGEEKFKLTKMFVNGQENEKATVGDKISIQLPFRIRLSDKIYKIIN